MNNKIAAIICGVISALYLPSAFATENGSDSFALGAEGMMAGAVPPAGIYLLSYIKIITLQIFKMVPISSMLMSTPWFRGWSG